MPNPSHTPNSDSNETRDQSCSSSIYTDPERLLRATDLQIHFGLKNGYSATLWRWVRDGKLPPPLYLNRQRVWRASDILEAEKRLLKKEGPSV